MANNSGMVEAKPGDWLLIRDWSRVTAREVASVTPKLIKMRSGYPKQVRKDDRSVVCVVSDREAAERLAQSLSGIDGECKRRVEESAKAHEERRNAAYEARDKQVARLLTAALAPQEGEHGD